LAVHRESVDETESFVPGKHTEGLQRALCGCVATSHWSFALFEPRVFLISSSFHHQSTSVGLDSLSKQHRANLSRHQESLSHQMP
jgi:hypothetical protein